MAWRKASEETKERRLDEETARAVSLLKKMGGIRAYEFDKLADAKGGVGVYQEMFRDERVWAGLRRVTAPIAALPWSVEPYRESDVEEPAPKDAEAAQFCEHCLRNLKGHFSKDVWDILDALPCGVSITEINYQYIERGRYAGKLGLQSLKAKNPDNYTIRTDDFLNVVGLANDTGVIGASEELDPQKFIVFYPLARYENPAGWSLFRSAYRHYWIKDTVLKLRAVFTERFAQGTVVGKYNPTNPESKAAMQKLVKTYKGETGIVIPNDAELEIIEQATKGETEFARFIRDCNEAILIAIVGSTLDTQEGEKTGALLATAVHRDTAQISVELYATWLADVITEQLLDRLIKLNYGDANTPVFRFTLRQPRDLAKGAQALEVLINKIGMQIPAAWVHDYFGIPKPAEGEEILSGGPAPAPMPEGPEAEDEHESFVEVTEDYVRIPVATGTVTATIDIDAKQGIKALYDGKKKIIVTYLFARKKGWTLSKAKEWIEKQRAKEKEGHAEQAWRRFRESEAELKYVKLNRIEETIDGLLKNSQAEGREAFGKLFESLKKPIREILEAGDYAAIGELRPVSANLRALMAKLFLTAHLAGKMHAVEEMRREWKALAPKKAKFPRFRKFDEAAETFAEAANADELLTIREAGKKFAGKVPMTRDVFKTLTRKAQGEAIYVAGLTADEVAKDIKPLVKKAIDEGMGWGQFRDVLADKATEFTDAAWIERKHPGAYKLAKRPYHAENVFRTNIMGAYNEGRRAAFEDPALEGEFPAWQYVAILDDRTREDHAAQDGKIYPRDDPYWDEWYPPNGFQCRCFVTAVSQWRFDPKSVAGATKARADSGFGKLIEAEEKLNHG